MPLVLYSFLVLLHQQRVKGLQNKPPEPLDLQVYEEIPTSRWCGNTEIGAATQSNIDLKRNTAYATTTAPGEIDLTLNAAYITHITK